MLATLKCLFLQSKYKKKNMSDNTILNKYEGYKIRFDQVSEQITDPEIMTDMKRYVKLNKDYKELETIVNAFKDYESTVNNIKEAKEMLAEESDPEMLEMAKLEIQEQEEKQTKLDADIKVLLIPKDPEDSKNAIVEIRAGTGGDEASIFAGDLYRMYVKFCESKGWKVSTTHLSEGTMGGYKEIVFDVSGADVYGILKYESGVHRVQRVPKTETQGRVHTSAASVAVLPEAEDLDIVIKKEDVRRDEYCSSGPGGQSVNTTYSAIRLTHIPTGIVVTCQDQKSKLKNLDKAMRELKTRLYNLEYQKRMEETAVIRRTMVSSGDRSAKIRTYNYPQGRVTDHRITLTLYNLPAIIDGDIGGIIEKLQIAENAEKMKADEI